MADPFTIMAVIGGASSVLEGIAGYSQAQYQAEIAKQNAEIARQNAVRAFETGQIDAMDNDLETAGVIGEQTAAQGASGLTLSGRSQVLTRQSALKLGRLDSLRIIANADKERYNFQTQAANFDMEAAAAKTSGKFALAGGALGAASAFAGYKSNLANATPTALNKRFVPGPVSRPTFAKRSLYRLTYGGPR